MDLGSIWGGFGASVGRLEAILGSPRRVLEASARGVFDRVAPPEGPRAGFGRIWARFWMDFGGYFGSFWHNFPWLL